MVGFELNINGESNSGNKEFFIDLNFNFRGA